MNLQRPLILASNSPRRQFLMRELGYHFAIQKPFGDETFPDKLDPNDVPEFLAKKKAESIIVVSDEIALTSDTVVILNNKILNKPGTRNEAIKMLQKLSGNTHIVITAVCIKDSNRMTCFHDKTKVTFNKLSEEEIKNYVHVFRPYDKAGAYGAQDCLPKGVNPCSKEELAFLEKLNKLDLVEKTFTNNTVGTGMNAIHKIDGSYFNVMGLPIHKVYQQLNAFQDITSP